MRDPLKRYEFTDKEGHPLQNCVEYREILHDRARMAFLEKFLLPSGKIRVEIRPQTGWLVLDAEKQGADTLREAIDAEMSRQGIAFRFKGDKEDICGNVGVMGGGLATVVCQMPPGHPGNHGGMGCEWTRTD